MKLTTEIKVCWNRPIDYNISPLPYFLKLFKTIREEFKTWGSVDIYCRSRHKGRSILYECYVNGYGWLVIINFKISAEIERLYVKDEHAILVESSSHRHVTYVQIYGKEIKTSLLLDFTITVIEYINLDVRSLITTILEMLDRKIREIGRLDFHVYDIR